MLRFDFSKYMDSFLKKEKYLDLESRKETIFERLTNDKMTGWYKEQVKPEVLEKIKQVSKMVRDNSDVLLVIGIGGSYMGSYSLQQLFSSTFKKEKPEVIYIGNNLSATYLKEVMDYVREKKVTVNVISKSGSTLEIKIAYNLIKEMMENKYSDDELKRRMIITTNTTSGFLKEEVEENGYIHFDMPDKIGGRYSMMTPAHLFPLSVMNYDIDEFLTGYYDGKKYINEAYNYAIIRNLMCKEGKYIENYSIYEPKLYYYTEFLKQLFGESEGKDGKGIFPTTTVNTRDLHSLGQFLQEGNKIIFETVLKINMKNDICYKNNSINEYNDIVCESVMKAHYEGNVPNCIIDFGDICEKTMGEVTMFFMLAAAFSAYLFEVDPFNQPGVEKYKSIMNEKISI